jgi:penicillin-binding protein 2
MAVFVVAGAAVLARLAVLQAAGHETFDRRRFLQVGGDHIVHTPRGGIYTRYGVPLAEDVPEFDLGVYYGDLGSDEWLEPAARLSGRSHHDLRQKARRVIERVERIRESVCRRNNNPNLHIPEEYEHYAVAENISCEAAAAVRVEPERYPSLRVLERTARRHAHSDLAPHVVGVVSRIDQSTWQRLRDEGRTWNRLQGVAQVGSRYLVDDSVGVSGIERRYERVLRGERGHVINRLHVGVLDVTTSQEKVPPSPGSDVYLTLRQDFQHAAQAAVAWAARQPDLDFDAGALVLLDVHSGAVVASATWPTYNLANYRSDYAEILRRPNQPLFYRPLLAQLPSGSVFKTVTAIAALQEGEITTATEQTCHQVAEFAGRRFHCEGYHSNIAIVRAIEKSCNIFFYKVGLLVGGDKLAEWGRRLGIGMPTGVDLAEAHGQLPNPRGTHGTVNLSIGQGNLLCTPLQVANMMAVVANGGRLYTPHFLHHRVDADGRAHLYRPTARRLDIRPDVLRTVRQGMRRVTQTGTARRSNLARYRVAGKTGTAQTGRRDEQDRKVYHAWFAGYVPWDEPKLAFAVVNEDTYLHGGDAAPIVYEFLWRVWEDVQAMEGAGGAEVGTGG